MDNNIIQHFANQFQVMQNNIKRQSGYLARQEINTLLNDIKKTLHAWTLLASKCILKTMKMALLKKFSNA